MVELIEALLAIVGFVAVILVLGFVFAVWLEKQIDGGTANDNHPYAEALATAARISSQGYEAQRILQALSEQHRTDRDQDS